MARSIELGDMFEKAKSPKKKISKTASSSKAKPAKAKSSRVAEIKKKIKADRAATGKKKKKSKTEIIAAGDALIRQGQQTIEIMQESVFDKNREQAEQYASMFYQLIAIKEIAEKKYFSSQQSRDIYALMKVYDQMREVIADMKALQDVGAYIDSMDGDVLRPYVTQTAQLLLEFIRHTEQHCRKVLSDEDADSVDKFIKKQGKLIGVKLNEAYRSSLDNTRKILVG